MNFHARPLQRTLILILLFTSAYANAQQAPEAAITSTQAVQTLSAHLLSAIEKIPIFDDHSHPGFADDADVDAMASPPGSIPLRLRPDNPELIVASKDLFGYPYNDATPDHLQWLVRRKAELRKQKVGTAYFDDILNRLNVEEVLANRVRPAAYLSPKRFRWVFFVDSLLFPFDNHPAIASNGNQAVFIPLQEKKLQDELAQQGLHQLPPTFDEYLAFITHLVENNQRHGGVAIKFEIAYFRSLHFDDPPKASAASVYAKFRLSGAPSEAEYKDFQDYVFRYLVREAGRLHLPVDLHTAVGVGDFYSLHGGTALDLENVLRDPRYEATTFILLHGGYPFQDQAIWLAARKNVYLDSSLMDLYLYPADFKTVLRHWLLLFPDKISFGSDAYPFSEAVGAEESYWIAVRTARVALASALAEMVINHEVPEAGALALARGYLHDNAAALYPH